MDKATKEEFAKVHKSMRTLNKAVGKQGKTIEGQGKAIDTLVKTMEKGFAAIIEDAAETRREFTARFVAIEGRLVNIEQELRSVRRDVETLKEKVGNIEGYGKEIDHALERITAIEKHLGIRPKLA